MNEDINQSRSHDAYTESYTGILNTYNDQIKESTEKKNTLKGDFFKIIRFIMLVLVWLFVGVIAASFILFGMMVVFKTESVTVITGAVTSVIASFSTMILSIFKLPKIVAKYLFNKKEDENMNTVIKNIQKYENKFVEQGTERLRVMQTKELDSAVKRSDADDNDDVLNETPPGGNGAPGDSLPESGSGPGNSGTSDNSGTSGDPGASA